MLINVSTLQSTDCVDCEKINKFKIFFNVYFKVILIHS